MILSYGVQKMDEFLHGKTFELAEMYQLIEKKLLMISTTTTSYFKSVKLGYRKKC